jgi:hypothetical protein
MGFVKVPDEQADGGALENDKISPKPHHSFLWSVYLCSDVSEVSCNWLKVMVCVHLHRI